MAPKKNSKEAHAYRITGDKDGNVVCGCGKKFGSDAEWREHYESLTSAAERRKLEGHETSPADRRKLEGQLEPED